MYIEEFRLVFGLIAVVVAQIQPSSDIFVPSEKLDLYALLHHIFSGTGGVRKHWREFDLA